MCCCSDCGDDIELTPEARAWFVATQLADAAHASIVPDVTTGKRSRLRGMA
jgi:hypothetical protein